MNTTTPTTPTSVTAVAKITAMASAYAAYLSNLTLSRTTLLLVIAYTIFLFARSIYRLYFHPLAKFPGPKLAALTWWYEFYYDVVLDGMYTFKIVELHKEYGPILRIAPNELHILPPAYYSTLFSQSGRWDKYAWWTTAFGMDRSTFTTVDHFHHRTRRLALNPFFSKQKVALLEPVVRERIERFCRRCDQAVDKREVIELRCAFAALSTDVMTEYVFARSYDHLSHPDFSPDAHETIVQLTRMNHLTKQLPFLLPIIKSLPDTVAIKLNPGIGYLLRFERDLGEQINQILAEDAEAKKLGRDNAPKVKDGQRPTVMHELLHSSLPPEEKTFLRLREEGELLIGAGGETAGGVLAVTTFYLLNDARVLGKLREELRETMPDRDVLLPGREVEGLPYLTACIQEGLRFAGGLSQRQMRLAPDRPLQFESWTIPPNTPVGMTPYLIHHDESIFPDSHTYRPERWLPDPAKGKEGVAMTPDGRERLDRYLVAFSKGTRMCVGVNLAYTLLYLALAALFRRYEFKIFETTEEDDVRVQTDWFLPHPKSTSKGIRVRVVGRLD